MYCKTCYVEMSIVDYALKSCLVEVRIVKYALQELSYGGGGGLLSICCNS